MNMLSSLKALLLSSAPMPGAAAVPATGQDTADFAAMLNGTMADAPPVDSAASPPVDAEAIVPAMPDIQPDVDQPLPPKAHDHVPPGLAVAVAAGKGTPTTLPPGLALGLVKHQAALQPASQPEAEPGTKDVETAPMPDVPLPTAPAASETVEVEPSAEPHRAHPMKDVAPAPLPVVAEAEPNPEAEPKAGAKPKASKEADANVQGGDAPQPNPADAAALIAPAPAIAPAPIVAEAAKDESDWSITPQHIAPAASALAAVVPQPIVAPGHSAEPGSPKPAPTLVASAPPGVVANQGKPAPESPALPIDSADPSAPILNGKPVKAEALSLLQLVREQVSARQSGTSTRVGEQVSAAASAKEKPVTPRADPSAVLSAASQPQDATPSVVATPAQPTVIPSATVSAPVVDLSASLGAQMVDMGVSGQWLDGLARDIAGLSANGAQGRFQIDTHHLGAVQVDIRQGGDGAAVSLTVANEAAEMALRQEGDRLKLDASLAAVRISDVRVERASPVAEAHRAEMGNQSSSQQQQPQQQGSQTASAWQQNNQNMGQPQGQQGRWQGRENNGFGPKGSADPAVLNHADAQPRTQDAVRARYA